MKIKTLASRSLVKLVKAKVIFYFLVSPKIQIFFVLCAFRFYRLIIILDLLTFEAWKKMDKLFFQILCFLFTKYKFIFLIIHLFSFIFRQLPWIRFFVTFTLTEMADQYKVTVDGQGKNSIDSYLEYRRQVLWNTQKNYQWSVSSIQQIFRHYPIFSCLYRHGNLIN